MALSFIFLEEFVKKGYNHWKSLRFVKNYAKIITIGHKIG